MWKWLMYEKSGIYPAHSFDALLCEANLGSVSIKSLFIHLSVKAPTSIAHKVGMLLSKKGKTHTFWSVFSFEHTH